MIRPATPAEALREVGGGETARVLRVLQAGLTNCSYLIELEGRPHVLRLDTPHAARFGLDRSMEAEIQRRAAGAGLAPGVRYTNPASGILVYEYLAGRALGMPDLAAPAVLERIAVTLRAVHALPVCGRILSTAGAAARYAAIVAGSRELGGFADRCLTIVTGAPRVTSVACCHNDVVAGNCIVNGGLRLIDWEYACDNDPMFDLASLIAYHDLGEQQAELLLAAYDDSAGERTRERLRRQRALFDALQWLWLAAQQRLAPAPRQLDRLAALRDRIG